MRGLLQDPLILRQGFAQNGAGLLKTGLAPQNIDFNAYNRNAGTLVVGDVMMLDMALASEAANFTIGDELSAWKNVIEPLHPFLEKLNGVRGKSRQVCG